MSLPLNLQMVTVDINEALKLVVIETYCDYHSAIYMEGTRVTPSISLAD